MISGEIPLILSALASSVDFDKELPAEHPVSQYLSLEFRTAMLMNHDLPHKNDSVNF